MTTDDQYGATAQTEAQQAQTLATENGAAAQDSRTTAATWQSRADQYSAYASAYQSRITDSPRNFWQRLLNRVYGALAEFSERVANNFQDRANASTHAANLAQATADEARTNANSAIARQTAAEATATNEESRAADLSQQASDTRQAAVDKQAEASNYLSQAENPTNNIQERRFVYGPNNRLIGTYQPNGTAEREIIRLGTLPVATVDTNGNLHYIHTDHLGTPRAVSQPGGTVVWRWISSPFGDTRPDEDVDGDGNTFTLNLRFPGQYFDAETGTFYNYFRDYDPGTGRYVQSDPIGLEGGINTFAYAEGNPILFFDPYGLNATSCELQLKACRTNCARRIGSTGACFVKCEEKHGALGSCENSKLEPDADDSSPDSDSVPSPDPLTPDCTFEKWQAGLCGENDKQNDESEPCE